jgi:hypothetical protein
MHVPDKSHASIAIDLPDFTVPGDAVNPMFEVFLPVSGGMSFDVSTYNLVFDIIGTGVEFTAVENAMTTPLFPDDFFSGSVTPTTVQAFKFLETDGNPMTIESVQLDDGDVAGLIKVSFTITPGTVGVFDLVGIPRRSGTPMALRLFRLNF